MAIVSRPDLDAQGERVYRVPARLSPRDCAAIHAAGERITEAITQLAVQIENALTDMIRALDSED